MQKSISSMILNAAALGEQSMARLNHSIERARLNSNSMQELFRLFGSFENSMQLNLENASTQLSIVRDISNQVSESNEMLFAQQESIAHLKQSATEMQSAIEEQKLLLDKVTNEIPIAEFANHVRNISDLYGRYSIALFHMILTFNCILLTQNGNASVARWAAVSFVQLHWIIQLVLAPNWSFTAMHATLVAILYCVVLSIKRSHKGED